MGLTKGQRHHGQWQPGTSGNPNGRPKGTKNKFSKKAKEHMMRAIGRHITNLEDDLENMTPSERVKAMMLMMKYFLATKKEIKKDVTQDVQITVSYADEIQKLENIHDLELNEETYE